MKKLQILLSFLIFSSIVNAQSDVYLRINHQINDTPFSTSFLASNNLGDNFTIARLEYYISEIKIIHDGGQETTIDDTWLLINAASATSTKELLGSYSITNLEGIKFSIGVDSATNHLDPSLYPSSHPLAPKSPSMHWGWVSGYRFLAIEGDCNGDNYQIHSLGDQNYFEQTINTAGVSENGDLIIDLNGNYERILESMTVSGGIIAHGEIAQAKTALVNMKDFVFVGAIVDTVNSIFSKKTQPTFDIYPNPTNGFKSIHLISDELYGNLVIRDITGKVIMTKKMTQNEPIEISNFKKGVYFISIQNKNFKSTNRKLIIN